MSELAKNYSHSAIEDKWYKYWEQKGLFYGDEKDKKSSKYSIVIPPPNVTGRLTLGHVLNNTLQDILIRTKKMQGYNVLWLPGTDHAGIATQNVVEKALYKEEKKSRHDIGRKEFLQKVWDWKEKFGSSIINELKKLGCSCDWSRLRFTMDKGLSEAVKECFVLLYKKGLIYRGRYIINWCPRCHTALSDEENIHKELNGKLWHIKYPFKNEKGYLVVATTRPETMLGDTAVAVNPKDKRYKDIIGKKIVLPLCGREIEIISDPFVDMAFGTGCVKVTPAHDPNDFEMGTRHDLKKIMVISQDGKMNENVPSEYQGLSRFEARNKIINDLEADNLLLKAENHVYSVGHCQRCDTITEPYLSTQWFVKYDNWIKPSLSALKNKELKFYPKKWEKTFEHWLNNIKDWCISRQLWWGHRIPAWYCQKCDEIIVSKDTPANCPSCSSKDLKQDEDVLDTWFSSWLWPFSTMGWPKNTETLKKFYPTDTLVTGPDIIFFWVARMVFAGIEFTGKLPFQDVYFTSMVRDMQGRKMSKSLGNSPEVSKVIDKYGADALRFTIIRLAPIGQDIHFAEEKCELGRNFGNKLWNTARFALMHLKDNKTYKPDNKDLQIEDKWILSLYNRTIKKIDDTIKKYHFNGALDVLYHFTWNELCDWYVEIIKSRLFDEKDIKSKTAALYTLTHVFIGVLKLIHPFIPFITEEIYSHINTYSNEESSSILSSCWPVYQSSKVNRAAEQKIELLKNISYTIRNLRAEKNIPPSKRINVSLTADTKINKNKLENMQTSLKKLCSINELYISDIEKRPQNFISAVASNIKIFIDTEGLVDKEAEKKKLFKEIEQTEIFLMKIEKKLENNSFVSKAPEAVVKKEREKRDSILEKIEKLKENLKILE